MKCLVIFFSILDSEQFELNFLFVVSFGVAMTVVDIKWKTR